MEFGSRKPDIGTAWRGIVEYVGVRDCKLAQQTRDSAVCSTNIEILLAARGEGRDDGLVAACF